MTEYADKEICERLRRLSGWVDTFAWYNGDAIEFEGEAGYEGAVYENTMQYDWSTDIPAYTLAFILDKLPKEVYGGVLQVQIVYTAKNWQWEAGYYNYYPSHRGTTFSHNMADTPTNAAALLACTLFEKGVLKGAAQNGEGEL